MLLVLGLNLQAQNKIGLIKPEEAMLKIEQFKELKMRFDQLLSVRTRELDSLKAVNEKLSVQFQEAQKSGSPNLKELASSLQYNSVILDDRKTMIDIELSKRNTELIQPFNTLFSALLEEIALEEGLILVLHPDKVDESFRKYIGAKNFIDITDLVVERAEDY